MHRQSEENFLNSNLHTSLQYFELRPTNGWDRFGSLGHLNKFQRVSRLGSVTAAMSLTGGQPNFARCLAVSRAGFGGSCPWRNFARCKIHFASIHVLPSPILAALLQGTPAAGVSQTLQRGRRNGIAKLSQRAPPMFGWAAITSGSGPHS